MEGDDSQGNQFSNTVIIDNHIRDSMLDITEGSNSIITNKEEKISKQIFKKFIVSEPLDDIPKIQITEKGININIFDHKLTEKRKIWIPKAICLISTYPFYDFMSGILIDLFYTVFHDHDN